MIEQHTAKQIKDNCYPFPWYCIEYANYMSLQTVDEYSEEDLLNEEKCPGAYFNGLAAVTAVNNTYGKGLNPEMYEDVVKALERSIENLMWLRCSSNTIYELQEILKKSRI